MSLLRVGARRALGFWLLSLAVNGCAVTVEERHSGGDGPIGDTDSAGAALYGNVDKYWSGSPVWIPVCWENAAAVPAVRLEWVRSAIGASWTRYARVNFIQWDKCTSGEPGVHILISGERPHAGSGQSVSGAGVDGVDGAVVLNLS